MNNLLKFFFIGLTFFPGLVLGQYPKEIKPGQTLSVTSGADTLWIIKNRQLDKCIIAGEKLKICTQTKDTLVLITKMQQEVITKKDSTIADLRGGYDRYKVKWEESDKQLEKTEIKLEKQKHKTKVIAIISSVGSIILTSLIFILL